MSHHDDNKVIILKNTTGSDITIHGRVISASGERDFSEIDPRKLRGRVLGGGSPQITLKELVQSGDIVVSDGTIDFGPKRGGSWLFGRHVSNLFFEYAGSNGVSTTTSTAFQQKVRLTWTATDADYLIEWTAEVRVQNSNRKIGVRCQFDDTQDINNLVINPSRSSADWGNVSGFIKVSLTPGVHTVDIDFRSSNAGALVGIRSARIKVTQAV